MADLNFPNSPVDGQIYEGYIYDGANGVWIYIAPSVAANNETLRLTAAYDKANAANLLAFNTGIGANTFVMSWANGKFLANTTGTFQGDLYITGSATIVDTVTTNVASFGTNSARDKIRLYDSEVSYAIGMANKMTFGPLRDDWAMTFQMNDDIDRGFWWGDIAHSNGQGAMALTTDGNLYVASKIRLGYGESDVADQETWPYSFDVSGNVNVATSLVVSGMNVVPTVVAAFNKANTAGGGSYFQGNNGDVGSATGLGDIFRVHTNILTANVTIYSGNNALAAGPITVQNGKSLTIQNNARVVII